MAENNQSQSIKEFEAFLTNTLNLIKNDEETSSIFSSMSPNLGLLFGGSENSNLYLDKYGEYLETIYKPSDISIEQGFIGWIIESLLAKNTTESIIIEELAESLEQLSLFEVYNNVITHDKREYATIMTSALLNISKQLLNNPTRIESPRRGQLKTEEHYLTKDKIITYKGPDGTYTITLEQVKELFSKRVKNGAKIFNFLLEKLNSQNRAEHTKFQLSELVETGIYANKDSAYRGLKSVTDKLMKIYVEGSVKVYEGRKRVEKSNIKAVLIAQRHITYGECIVVLPPIIRESAPYITILPRWGYSLQSDNAYMLLDYIYYLARQNTQKLKDKGTFNIGLNTIRQHLGLPSPEEIKNNHDSKYTKYIIDPIEEAITKIEDAQQGNELKITPRYEESYKNIDEYLEGYLEIELSGEALEFMEDRATAQKKKQANNKRLPAKEKSPITTN